MKLFQGPANGLVRATPLAVGTLGSPWNASCSVNGVGAGERGGPNTEWIAGIANCNQSVILQFLEVKRGYLVSD